MYKAIYREYRPEIFDSMLGQDHIVRILQNQIATESVNHAYLFCGTRGTGKTTTARLLAKAVNCLAEEGRPCGECANCKAVQNGSFVDLIEIDAASNNGVDAIREIRDSVEYAPVAGRKKVYIIDEVHMLTPAAFNALLKTLEEPPKTVMFILCTTEPEKLPATILSRCMRMDFRRVSETTLTEAMKKICVDKNVEVEEGSLRLIAANADGSVRDCLTLLEQCIAGRTGQIDREEILNSLGAVGEDSYIKLTEEVLTGDIAGGLLTIAKMLEGGSDPRQVLRGWMNHYRNLMLAKFIRSPEDILNMSLENVDRVRQQAERTPIETINEAVLEISKTLEDTKMSARPRILLEICFVKLASPTMNGEVRPVRPVSQVAQPARRQESVQVAPQAVQNPPIEQVSQAAQETQQAAQEPKMAQGMTEPAPAYEESGAQQVSEAPEESMSAGDESLLLDIWTAVLDAGEQVLGGPFMLIQQNAQPVKMNDREYVISVTGLAAALVEQHRKVMEDMIEKAGGVHRQLLIRDDKADGADAEDLTQKIQSTLGIDHIEIVEES